MGLASTAALYVIIKSITGSGISDYIVGKEMKNEEKDKNTLKKDKIEEKKDEEPEEPPVKLSDSEKQ